MDTLHAMQAFVKIVDAGSLTAAARALDVSQPSMVRTLAALERELGVRLLNRSTRRMALTDEGRDYLARCRHILAAVDEAQASLHARRAQPAGQLRITAPVVFGTRHLVPLVSEFLATHAQVSVDLLLLDRVVDVIEEGIDLALRIAHLADSAMVALALGQTRRIVVGAPALIARLGEPRAPGDLSGAPCVSATGLTSGGAWDLVGGRRTLRVPVRSVLVTNQIDAALRACLDGVGWGRFLCYQVAGEIADGRLQEVLAAHAPPATPVHLVYPQARLLSPAVRAFIDFAAPRLRLQLPQPRGAR